MSRSIEEPMAKKQKFNSMETVSLNDTTQGRNLFNLRLPHFNTLEEYDSLSIRCQTHIIKTEDEACEITKAYDDNTMTWKRILQDAEEASKRDDWVVSSAYRLESSQYPINEFVQGPWDFDFAHRGVDPMAAEDLDNRYARDKTHRATMMKTTGDVSEWSATVKPCCLGGPDIIAALEDMIATRAQREARFAVLPLTERARDAAKLSRELSP